MAMSWITLSYEWDITDAQATLNIIISLLATISIWTLSRLWYQTSTSKVISQRDVPLSSLFTISSLGDAWDLLVLLRGKLINKRFLPLLIQTLVVILVSLAAILSGPIAKYSLRTSHTLVAKSVEGLLGTAPPQYGPYAGTQAANVFWNVTMDQLEAADFPIDQLLDYLPSSTTTWVYDSAQWNSSWTASCIETERTPLSITANSSYSILDPINAFPEFGATYDQAMLNTSEYRQSSFFSIILEYDVDGSGLVRDLTLFVLVQSEPTLDGRMFSNRERLHLSLSVLHVRNISLPDVEAYTTVVGPAEMSDYTRTECYLMRRPNVTDTGFISWPWTNDTASIVQAYSNYYEWDIVQASSEGGVVAPLPPKEIFRFYQAYMISCLTVNVVPAKRTLNVLMEAIQLSTVTLVVALLLSLFITIILGHYAYFILRYKRPLKASRVPDARLDWILHAYKNSKHVGEDDLDLPDRELFADALYEQDCQGSIEGSARLFKRCQPAASLSSPTQKSGAHEESSKSCVVGSREEVESAEGDDKKEKNEISTVKVNSR